MTDQPGPLAGLTVQDQRLLMNAFKSLKGGFEVSSRCSCLSYELCLARFPPLSFSDHHGYIAVAHLLAVLLATP